jgi:replicative DNA helicase
MILSCLLINSEAIEMTLQTLPIEAFYFKNHQEIYKAIILCMKINYQLISYFNNIFTR